MTFVNLTNRDRGLHLGIDAINIRQGGGVTHLSQLLQVADPYAAGFESVTVWSSQVTSHTLPTRPWLIKRNLSWIEAPLPRRVLGQQFQLGRELEASGCNVLFSPGGTLPYKCRLPAVMMSQNLLPFDPKEAIRFGRFSLMRLKIRLLRYSQGHSFRRANGLIFLTRYAEEEISRAVGGFPCPTALVPHGIETRFLQSPRPQRLIGDCSIDQPFRVLYVSILMPYKHQIEVAKAAANLRAKGMPIEMLFIGTSWEGYGFEFKNLIKSLDYKGEFLKWAGHVPFDNLHRVYRDSDIFVFASSCENLPNILIEAMASGLPIACSHRGPMPAVLGDAGVYFDPESPSSIAQAIAKLANDPGLREQLAQRAWQRAQEYSWIKCAKATFEFIAKVAMKKRVIDA